jgi:uncharacterized integral membrane protein
MAYTFCKKMSEQINITKEDLYKIDYEKALGILQSLSEQKLAYQKAYMALFSGSLVVTLAVARFSNTSGTNLSFFGSQMTLETILGILFLFVGILGLVVVRNLTSIRVSEVFFNNTIIVLRNRLIESANVESGYPNLVRTRCRNRRGSDYFSIIVGSILNLVFLLLGCVFLFTSMNLIQSVFVTLLFVVAYILIHCFTVERELQNGDRLWKKDAEQDGTSNGG